MPCKLGASCQCKNHEKKYCKNWEPGRGTRYYTCSRFIATRATCDQPPEDCATCPHFIAAFPKRNATINWKDKDAVRAHRAKYMAEYRKRIKQ